ncbi:MAG: hypothetical protein KAT77_04455 [Nanoarchaeota archaeon]|nr:hypothetical protein [Nanoarchaeota archaeon]
MKDFESCKKEGIVIEDERDIDRAKNLLEKAMLRKEFWSKSYNKKYDFLIVEGYYEVIKELLTALVNLKGFKSSNHECLVAFFNETFEKYAYEAEIIDTLRRVRNAIDYRGVYSDENYLKNNKLEFEHTKK